MFGFSLPWGEKKNWDNKFLKLPVTFTVLKLLGLLFITHLAHCTCTLFLLRVWVFLNRLFHSP